MDNLKFEDKFEECFYCGGTGITDSEPPRTDSTCSVCGGSGLVPKEESK